MSSNLIKIIAAVFVVLAVILAVIGYRMSHDYADNASKASQQASQAQAPATTQIQVVMAIKPLLANQKIDPASLKVVGVEVAPEHYFISIDDVAGQTPYVDIDTGTVITPRLLGFKDPIAKLVPAGHKAVSLTLTDVIGVGGFVRPGDIVDVLVYLKNDQGNKVDPAQARILLKDALVLGSDEQVIPPPSVPKGQNGDQQQQQPQRHERTVVVAVPDEDVTRVMLGASLGDVRLALHGNQDQTQTAAEQPAGAPPAGATPTPVSGGSLSQVASAAPAKPSVDQPLPDMPYTSAELARLKPPHPVKGSPQGIVIYHGSKASTVYP